MNLKNKYHSAIFENILPLCGVLLFGWSAFSLLLAYWLETLVVGFYTLLKLQRSTKNFPVNSQNKLVPGPLREVKPFEKKFAMIFFLFHYGIFCLVHFMFLKTFANFAHDSISFSWLVLLSALPFFIIHGKKFQEEFVETKEYEKIPLAKILFSPYKRIALLHIVVLCGGIPFIFLQNTASPFAVFLIVLKMFLEGKIDQKSEHIIQQIDVNKNI